MTGVTPATIITETDYHIIKYTIMNDYDFVMNILFDTYPKICISDPKQKEINDTILMQHPDLDAVEVAFAVFDYFPEFEE